MKSPNALATRDLLIFVAMVASAITWHVREHVIAPTASTLSASRICEPSSSESSSVRMVPADCGTRAKVKAVHAAQPWV